VALLAGLGLLAGSSPANGTRWVWSQEGLQQKLARKLEKRSQYPHPYQYPSQAQQYFFEKRAPRGHHALPMDRYTRALERMQRMPRHSLRANRTLPSPATTRRLFSSVQASGGSDPPFKEAGVLPTWTFLGPDNIAGRTRALLIDPGTPATMYAAGVAGGVWKSTDSGSTWAPIADLIANLAVNSMAMDPGNSSVIYAGTGEGFFNFDQVRGNGIFKTTDGGANWTHLANTASDPDFHYVNDIVVSPNNSSRVYVATRRGIIRSTDGGSTWSVILQPLKKSNPSFIVTGGCLDLAIRDVGAADVLFTACGTFDQASIYRTLDGGATTPTFTEVLTETNMGRTSLAIAPSNPEVVYALSASLDSSGNYEDGLHKVFRTTDSDKNPLVTADWTTQVDNTDTTLLNTLLLTNPLFGAPCGGSQFFNQGWYDNVIAVDPLEPDIVWVGGIDLFRSNNAGVDWGLASYWWASDPGADPDPSDYAHADQHVIVFHPEYDGITNQTMFAGNDGGLYRTTNARAGVDTGPATPCSTDGSGVAWTEINNNFSTTQFYHGVPYPGGLTFFGGTQDNGTLRVVGATTGWEEIQGGDGGYVAVEPTNTNILYAETPNGSIRKSINGGASFSVATSGISDSGFLFIAPFVLDPSGSQTDTTRKLWTGGQFIWRSDNAAGSWTQASTAIDNDPSFTSTNRITAIAVAPTDSDTVLVGTRHGIVYRNTAAVSAINTTVWSPSQPRDGAISWLAFDPNDGTNQTVYATVSSFNFGGPDNGHIFKSTDTGASWSDVTGDLPDIPVHSIVVDPSDASRLCIATDLGVFISTNGGTNWAVENTGFANVITEALAVEPVSGTPNLFAFTHGRGVWRVALPTAGDNPVPVLASFLSPSSVPENAASFTLTVFGSDFVADSVVRWNGANRTTAFLSATQLTATIPSTDVLGTGSATVTVFNPTPGGGTSSGLTFNFSSAQNLNPPAASALVPSATVAGGPGLTLSVVGSDFREESFVRWNEAALPTRYVNDRLLTATIPARALARTGVARVSVFDAVTGASNPLSFTILPRTTLERGHRSNRYSSRPAASTRQQ